MAVELLRSKLPGAVMVNLLKERTDRTQPWTMKELTNQLKTHLDIHEAAYGNLRAENTNRNTGGNPVQKRYGNEHQRARGASNFAANFSNTQPTSNTTTPFSGKPHFPCIFCEQDHFHEQCSKFKTTDERQKQLSSLNHCAICLHKGHCAANC